MEWYPRNPDLLEKSLNEYLEKPSEDSKKEIDIPKEINGLIVPHAGYIFSGAIAGKAFSLLKKSEKVFDRAIILAPSHYESFRGIRAINEIETPLGEIKITENDYPKLEYEHAIDNQVPFLQKLEISEVLPLVIGEIDKNQIKEAVEYITEELQKNPHTIIVVSTDLSHFLDNDNAIKTDKQTLEIIQNLNSEETEKINACGKYPLEILIELCRQKNWQPQLIEYKNSGDVIGDKSRVVGYASLVF